MYWQIIFCLFFLIFSGSCKETLIQKYSFPQNLEQLADSLGFSGYILTGDTNGIKFYSEVGEDQARGLYSLHEPKFFPENILAPFIAVSFLWLQEKALIDFNDLVETILPEVNIPGEVTIRHLLSQTSGLPRLEDLPADVYQQIISSDFNAFNLETMAFQPGEQHQFSNTACFLLITAFEKITDQKFEDFLLNNFFLPSAMNKSSYFQGSIEDIARLTGEAYHLKNSERKNVIIAGLITTLEDLYHWDQSIHSGRIVDKKILNIMHHPIVLNNDVLSNYGYGWNIDPNQGVHLFQEGKMLHIQARYDHYLQPVVTIILHGTSRVNDLTLLSDYLFRQTQTESGFYNDISKAPTRVWIDL